jgi:drug/metabolite transporter (DMT)-like permease
MPEFAGILAAIASSALGGLSIGVTRFAIGATDPMTLGAFRFGIGCLVLLPWAWWSGRAWPAAPAAPAIVLLGLDLPAIRGEFF